VGEFATGSSSNVGEVNVLERMALGAESSGSIVAMTPLLRVVGLAASGGLGMFCCDTGPTELVRFGAGRSVMSGLSVEFATGGMEGAGSLVRGSEGFGTDTGLGGTGIATRDAQLVHVTNRAPAGASVSETRLSAPQAEQVASIIHMNHTSALPGSLSGNAGLRGRWLRVAAAFEALTDAVRRRRCLTVPCRFGRARSSALNRRQRHCRRCGAARSASRYLWRAASCCALSPGLPAWFRGR
jgi:hypothetical protein